MFSYFIVFLSNMKKQFQKNINYAAMLQKTIPVTSAECKCTCMKHVNNYLRNSLLDTNLISSISSSY